MLKLVLVTLFAYVVYFYVDVGAECISNSVSFVKAIVAAVWAGKSQLLFEFWLCLMIKKLTWLE